MLSIVIPTYHRNDLLELCLECLSPNKQTLDIKDYEVIVTDDGKVSNAQQLVESKFPWCKWVQGPQVGPASNRNNGAKQSKGNWIVFIDDDCLPDANILFEYKRLIKENPNIEVFEGCIKADRAQKRFDEESPLNLYGGGYMWSCNIMVSKNVFYKMNGFDEGFPHAAMEDVDFAKRIQQADFKIVFADKAFVVHPYRRIKGFKFVKNKHESYVYLLRKNKVFREGFSFKKVTEVYLRDSYKVLKNCLKYKFRGFLFKIITVNYNYFLKLKYIFSDSKNNQITG